jgi:hypothetical protein
MAQSDIVPRPDLGDLAERINAEHQQAEVVLRRGLEHAKNAGELLLQAKEHCGHGQWLPWLKENVHFSVRTAQAYMRIAKEWNRLEAKSATVAHLGYREALELLTVSPVDVDANLERATVLLREGVEMVRAGALNELSFEELLVVRDMASECVSLAQACKINAMTDLGEVLRRKRTGD